jgi:hypothetical protein
MGPTDGGRHDSDPGHCDAAPHDGDTRSHDFAIGRGSVHVSASFIPIAGNKKRNAGYKDEEDEQDGVQPNTSCVVFGAGAAAFAGKALSNASNAARAVAVIVGLILRIASLRYRLLGPQVAGPFFAP